MTSSDHDREPDAAASAASVPTGARVVTDRHELVEFFSDRRAVHVYALADLDDRYWPSSRWYRRGDAVVGLVALPDGDAVACYAVATRDPDGTLGLLADLAPSLPSGQLVTGPVGTAQALAVRTIRWSGPHTRFELVDRSALPPPDERVEPLGRADLAALSGLYAVEPEAAFFLPHMVDDDTFVGVRGADGGLVAAAGTHVVSAEQRVAAIGAVYTHPAHRGRGLGRATTAAVVRRLDRRHGGRPDVIGLNAADDNDAARHMYRSMGFRPIQPYEEAQLG